MAAYGRRLAGRGRARAGARGVVGACGHVGGRRGSASLAVGKMRSILTAGRDLSEADFGKLLDKEVASTKWDLQRSLLGGGLNDCRPKLVRKLL